MQPEIIAVCIIFTAGFLIGFVVGFLLGYLSGVRVILAEACKAYLTEQERKKSHPSSV